VNTSADVLAEQIDRLLRASGDARRAQAEKRYLKSDLEFLGTGVPAIRAAVKTIRKAHPDPRHDTVVELARLLWRLPVHERRLAAVETLAAYRGALGCDDMGLVEKLAREARTWALVDPLAMNIAAVLVERYAELGATLDRWATDRDFWLRRTALLALLPPLRAGRGDFDRFGRYADAMLEEREFFIRKAIGWVLRELSKQRPDLVAAWLLPRAWRSSGVTVREAVKYLPPRERDEVLRAYRARAILP
jgi:3-methyladenine DNA glycosylase AlkD